MGGATPRRERGTVSAEEHERLRRDLDALRDQFEAADEVLSALGPLGRLTPKAFSRPSSRARAGSAGPMPPTSTACRTASTG